MQPKLTLAETLDQLTAPGELYERREDGRLHCYACAHNCGIGEGRRGICKVRFNQGGTLYIPWGYVGPLQCDPVEKKPYFHALPGSDALTFGMLGCDMHCGYCFTGETAVITEQGARPLAELFDRSDLRDARADADIAYPTRLRVVSGSGQLRQVRALFRHHYAGPLVLIRPLAGPAIHCTPDHSIYTLSDPTAQPVKRRASELALGDYLVTPRPQTPPIPELDSFVKMLAGQTGVLASESAYLIPIQELGSMDHDGPVYNMEVAQEHNYLAGFFLAANCQNHITSQALRDPSSGIPPTPASPAELVEAALRQGARLLVSSYNEPLITAEWGAAVFKQARSRGLLTGFVSNGNATRGVLEYIRPWTDCYKIDLKTMSDRSYRQLGTKLEHVLNGARMVHELGFWLELLTLVVPGFNDSDAELREAAQFVASLSPDVPWHVTAFHKDYKMIDNDNTSAQDLLRAVEIGREAGLRYVYAGNLPGRVGEWEHTCCPGCQTTLIRRYAYVILDYQLTPAGACPRCDTRIPGIWPAGGRAEVRLGSTQDLYRRVPRPVRGLRSDTAE